ncbi:galactokinase family protein [Corynebacterium pacaense]|uniref:galactokinase family protein n=1 Tax=Corynebacterium pacaense TaxID=1816684 RepID=UPI0009BB34D2|nr:galactokinase family protein [Corynebacterium pacaense]
MPIWQPRLNNPAGEPIGTTPRELAAASIAYHRELFNEEPTGTATAPATWSLIGEHTDHAGGIVVAALAQWTTSVSVAPASGDTVSVAIVGEGGVDRREAEFAEILALAAAKQDEDPVRATPPPPAGPEIRLGGLVWTMVHRQLLSRDTRGVNITVISTIPQGCGLGEDAALETATALALYAEDTREAPVRARLAEACTQAAIMFNPTAPLRARHTVALRGDRSRVSVVNYADCSVTQIAHPVSATSGLRALAVSAPFTPGTAGGNTTEPQVLLQRRRFLDEAARAFSVESLRLLPDAPTRVADWLAAMHEVVSRPDLPTLTAARDWLGFWEDETLRAQRTVSALRSRRRSDIARLLGESQEDLGARYQLISTDGALAQLCLARGALSARSSSAGLSSAVIVLIDARSTENFSADLSADGLLVVPLDHGDVASPAS